MTNKFSHIKSQPRVNALLPEELRSNVSQRETSTSIGRPKQHRLGKDAFETLMGLLSEDNETPSTPYGILLANSTKRNLRKQIREVFIP